MHSVTRVDARSLSVAEFASRFEAARSPVILTNIVSSWPAAAWTEESLRGRFGSGKFNVGGHEMQLDNFFDYCRATVDEQPLYLFDKAFATKAPPLAREYTPPHFFAPERDLFDALPADCRPDFRWLIIGGTRSGSSWHIDPNASSAWNAVLCGEKKWILCPPHAPPPGVTASDNGASVMAPVSLFEWFRVFYPEIEASRHLGEPCGRPVECVQRAGELLFVPRGWWHTAINLQPTIAITQVRAHASGYAGGGGRLRERREGGCGCFS